MPTSFDPTPRALACMEGQNKSAVVNRSLGYLARLLDQPSPLGEEERLVIELCRTSGVDFSEPMAGLVECAIDASMHALPTTTRARLDACKPIITNMDIGQRIALHERICRR